MTLAGAVVGLVAFFGSLAWWITREPGPSSELTANLPGDWAVASALFDRRVRQRFPVGSPEAVLAATLLKQGFAPTDMGGVTGTEHTAARDVGSFPCRIVASVTWRSDAQRRIVNIAGVRKEQGCL